MFDHVIQEGCISFLWIFLVTSRLCFSGLPSFPALSTTLECETFAGFLTDFELLQMDKNYNSGFKMHDPMQWEKYVSSTRGGHMSREGSPGCLLWVQSLPSREHSGATTQCLLLKPPNLIAEQIDPGILQAEPSPEGPQARAQPISKTIRPSEK